MYYYYYLSFVIIEPIPRVLENLYNAVDSRYLEVQGLLKYFEISVPRHIRFAELRKK